MLGLARVGGKSALRASRLLAGAAEPLQGRFRPGGADEGGADRQATARTRLRRDIVVVSAVGVVIQRARCEIDENTELQRITELTTHEFKYWVYT